MKKVCFLMNVYFIEHFLHSEAFVNFAVPGDFRVFFSNVFKKWITHTYFQHLITTYKVQKRSCIFIQFPKIILNFTSLWPLIYLASFEKMFTYKTGFLPLYYVHCTLLGSHEVLLFWNDKITIKISSN